MKVLKVLTVLIRRKKSIDNPSGAVMWTFPPLAVRCVRPTDKDEI